MAIVVTNTCLDLVDNSTAQKWFNAIQRQVDSDLAPHWCQSSTIHYVGDSKTEKPGVADHVLRLVHASGEDGTLGSHWFESGRAVGEVGIQTCIDEDVPPEACASHEILEMTVDPSGTLCYQLGRLVLIAEICDRVESSDPDYKIDGVTVENFSLPSAFIGTGGPWDFRRKCASNIVLPNGYQLQVDLGSGQWTQITGSRARRSKCAAKRGSRRAMRMLRAGADPSKLVLAAA